MRLVLPAVSFIKAFEPWGEQRERGTIYCDNTNVCDTSISWFEADKTPVITTDCFCATGKGRRLLGRTNSHDRYGKAKQQNGQNIFIINVAFNTALIVMSFCNTPKSV
jgi:hypothetical protein